MDGLELKNNPPSSKFTAVSEIRYVTYTRDITKYAKDAYVIDKHAIHRLSKYSLSVHACL